MNQTGSNQDDLNFFADQIEKNVHQLRKFFPLHSHRNQSTQPTKHSRANDKFNLLEKNIQKLISFTKHVAKYAERTSENNRKREIQLRASQKQLRFQRERVADLEEESLILRKKLNESEKEIQHYKQLNKINVSYVSSIELREEEKSLPLEQPDQKSFNSVQCSAELGSYNSCIEEEEQGEEEEMSLNRLLSVQSLLESLEKKISDYEEEKTTEIEGSAENI